jgi:hypothetical protein
MRQHKAGSIKLGKLGLLTDCSMISSGKRANASDRRGVFSILERLRVVAVVASCAASTTSAMATAGTKLKSTLYGNQSREMTAAKRYHEDDDIWRWWDFAACGEFERREKKNRGRKGTSRQGYRKGEGVLDESHDGWWCWMVVRGGGSEGVRVADADAASSGSAEAKRR